jgi:hypothetical protein
MDRYSLEFLDWWARLNLALDDAGAPEAGFGRAWTLYRAAEYTGTDPDQVIIDEVTATRVALTAAFGERD